MSERYETQHQEHPCKCDSCCGDLFMCGDPIIIFFVTQPTGTGIPGTYISSSCDRLIWRREGTNTVECTPCKLVTIIKPDTGTSTANTNG